VHPIKVYYQINTIKYNSMILWVGKKNNYKVSLTN